MKKPSKRAIGGITAALIIIVGGTIFALRQSNTQNVSQDDYQQAQTATGKLQTAYTNLENAYYSYSVATPPATNELNALTAKLGSYQTAASEITNLKALESGEPHAKYQAFTAKNEKYVAELNGYIKDRGALTDLQASECYKKATSPLAITPDVVSNFEAILKDCQSNMTTLKASDSVSLQAYATALEKYFAERKTNYDELTKAVTGTSKTALTETFAKISAMQPPDANKEIQTAHAKASITQAVQDLANQTSKAAVKSKAADK